MDLLNGVDIMSKTDDFLITKQYVLISSYRVKILKAIGEDVKIPTKIAKDCGIRPNHISKVLGELKKCGLVECLNEEVRKGRLYRLTDLGLLVFNDLE